MVPQVHEREEWTGKHPEQAGGERAAPREPEMAAESVGAASGHDEVEHDVPGVERPRRHEEMQPRDRVEDLGVRVRQQGLAERDVGVPDRPGSGGHRVDEHLHLRVPLHRQVPVEELAPAEDRLVEQGQRQGQERERHPGLAAPVGRARASGRACAHRNLSLRAREQRSCAAAASRGGSARCWSRRTGARGSAPPGRRCAG